VRTNSLDDTSDGNRHKLADVTKITGTEKNITAKNNSNTKVNVSHSVSTHYIYNGVMRMTITSSRNKTTETPVLKSEYTKIVEAFFSNTDPMGRLRWTINQQKKLGLNSMKILAVKLFLTKKGLIDTKPGIRSTYIDERKDLVQKALEAWNEIKKNGCTL